jgi:hypothetical protein
MSGSHASKDLPLAQCRTRLGGRDGGKLMERVSLLQQRAGLL